MKRGVALVLVMASIASIASIGCGRREVTKKKPAPVEIDHKADERNGKMDAARPLAEVAALPEDFSLEYTTRTAGIDPSDEEFIRIEPSKDGGWALTTGKVARNGGITDFVVAHRMAQTEEHCLKVYNQARTAGFFELKDRYEGMEMGGILETVKITAGGGTKMVSVYGTRVKEFDLVTSAIQELHRLHR